MLCTITEFSLESLLGNNRNIAFWVVLFLLIVVLFNVFSSGAGTMQTREISYSDFVTSVRGGSVSSATLDGEKVRIVTTDNSEYVTIRPNDAECHRAVDRKQRGHSGRATRAIGHSVVFDDDFPFPFADRGVDFLYEPDAGRRPRRGHGLW